MTTIRAHFDGKAFIPDEPVDIPVNQKVMLDVRPEIVARKLTPEEFESLLQEMDRDAVTTNHPVDYSRETIYTGTIDDTR